MKTLCKVVSMTGQEISPAQEVKPPGLWDQVMEEIFDMATAQAPIGLITETLEQKYKIEKL